MNVKIASDDTYTFYKLIQFENNRVHKDGFWKSVHSKALRKLPANGKMTFGHYT